MGVFLVWKADRDFGVMPMKVIDITECSLSVVLSNQLENGN